MKDFYVNVASSEAACIHFLQQNALLGEEGSHDPCPKCGGGMVEKRRKNRKNEWVPVLRCTAKGCQTYRSLREGNQFFHYTDVNGRLNSNLTLCQIMEMVYHFILEIPLRTTVEVSGRSSATVTDYHNFCREVCTAVLKNKPKMKGTFEDPIQIDESRFAGKRKYNRGRMLAGDAPPQSVDEEADVQNNRNHGARVDGPWVFGLKQGNDCRYFIVPRRDKRTLIPIIKNHCEVGSHIHSDEWPAYRCLTDEGYEHESVNHQENYVDPVTGAHTQSIERSWLDAKVKILKKMRGVPLHMLQGHLDEYCWRMSHKGEDLFLAFLDDLRRTYV